MVSQICWTIHHQSNKQNTPFWAMARCHIPCPHLGVLKLFLCRNLLLRCPYAPNGTDIFCLPTSLPFFDGQIWIYHKPPIPAVWPTRPSSRAHLGVEQLWGRAIEFRRFSFHAEFIGDIVSDTKSICPLVLSKENKSMFVFEKKI